jgi:hypothetical protein
VFFAGMGSAWFNGQPSADPCTSSGYNFSTTSTEICAPQIDVKRDAQGFPIADANGNPIPVFGPPRVIDGFRLKDGRASYGLGLETFALGFPIHFDWSWRTLFNKDWEDVLFATVGAATSSASRASRCGLV